MNIIYETHQWSAAATFLIPTAMVDAMNPGGRISLAARRRRRSRVS